MSKLVADLIVYGLTAAWVAAFGAMAVFFIRRALRPSSAFDAVTGWDRFDAALRAGAVLVAVMMMLRIAGERLMAGGL